MGRRRARRPARTIEHREWIPLTLTQGGINPADNSNPQAFRLGADDLKSQDTTILRVRGTYHCWATNVGTVTHAVFGGIVLPHRYASSTDQPNPLSASDSDDWLIYQPFLLSSKTIHGNDTYTNGGVIDSKAMRKVGADDDLVFVLGLDGVNAFGSDDRFDFHAVLRV